MAIVPEFDSVREYEVVGEYPPIKGLEINGMEYFPSTPQYNRPISPRENFHRRFNGRQVYWMVEVGWTLCDVNEFRPRQHPDNMANHQCIDGGERPDYAGLGDEVIGWFGLPLRWEAGSMGCMVRPGYIALDDMNDWKSLPWPNLDDIDFDEMAHMNREYLGVDKANQLGIQFGFWERMMNLMGVDNAAVALMDEDQEDAVHEFLDKLSDTYIDYVRRILATGIHLDSVFFHDDWGTQNAAFFSLETCRDLFVLPMRKLVDFLHENDIVFEHHCCGKAQDLVPAMVDCGTGYWYPQRQINDVDMLLERYKDEHITFAVGSPVLPVGSSEEDIRVIAQEYVDKYLPLGALCTKNANLYGDPNHDQSLYPLFSKYVYECSRIACAGKEA